MTNKTIDEHFPKVLSVVLEVKVVIVVISQQVVIIRGIVSITIEVVIVSIPQKISEQDFDKSLFFGGEDIFPKTKIVVKIIIVHSQPN